MCGRELRSLTEHPHLTVAVYADSEGKVREYGELPILNRTVFNESEIAHPEHGNILSSPNWLGEFFTTLNASFATQKRLFEAFPSHKIEHLSQYTDIYEFFMNDYPHLKPASKYWHRENSTDPKLGQDERWTLDSVFEQSRLMGDNPLQIQRVTRDGQVGIAWSTLNDMLNNAFPEAFNSMVSDILGPESTIESVSVLLKLKLSLQQGWEKNEEMCHKFPNLMTDLSLK